MLKIKQKASDRLPLRLSPQPSRAQAGGAKSIELRAGQASLPSPFIHYLPAVVQTILFEQGVGAENRVHLGLPPPLCPCGVRVPRQLQRRPPGRDQGPVPGQLPAPPTFPRQAPSPCITASPAASQPHRQVQTAISGYFGKKGQDKLAAC